MDGGVLIAEGETLRNARLGATLSAVADGGAGGIAIVVAGTGIVAGTGAASVADVAVSVVADPSAASAASAATTGADVNSEDSGNEESE